MLLRVVVNLWFVRVWFHKSFEICLRWLLFLNLNHLWKMLCNPWLLGHPAYIKCTCWGNFLGLMYLWHGPGLQYFLCCHDLLLLFRALTSCDHKLIESCPTGQGVHWDSFSGPLIAEHLVGLVSLNLKLFIIKDLYVLILCNLNPWWPNASIWFWTVRRSLSKCPTLIFPLFPCVAVSNWFCLNVDTFWLLAGSCRPGSILDPFLWVAGVFPSHVFDFLFIRLWGNFLL